jgi:hypothetical protein
MIVGVAALEIRLLHRRGKGIPGVYQQDYPGRHRIRLTWSTRTAPHDSEHGREIMSGPAHGTSRGGRLLRPVALLPMDHTKTPTIAKLGGTPEFHRTGQPSKSSRGLVDGSSLGYDRIQSVFRA